MLIRGFGRVGSAVAEAPDISGVRDTVVDRDPEVVRAVHARGLPAVFDAV